MQEHTVTGGGGLKLHVAEQGKRDRPPILFIHGWSQSHLCWSRQFRSPLADGFRLVGMDLRGHGQSEAPLHAEHYAEGALWADDVDSVITALRLESPVLVGWSYGGLVVSDYLRKYGDGAIAGVNFVGAAMGIGDRWFGTFIGPAFMDHAMPACSRDQAVALDAVRGLVHAFFAKPVAAEEIERAIGCAMLVHPKVRKNLISREEDFSADLSKLRKPVLVTYGDADTVILPAMAEELLAVAPNSRPSAYPGVGHAPFIEEATRFNDELAQFADESRV